MSHAPLKRSAIHTAAPARRSTSLRIAPAHDRFETEADRAADQVVARGSKPQLDRSAVKLQRVPAQGAGESADPSPSVSTALASKGDTLAPDVRTDMERGFGRQFSDVRVHHDATAATAARDVAANAFTVGNHIVFGESKYAPRSEPGRHLIAHELAHVVQQSGSVRPTVLQRDATGGSLSKVLGPARGSSWHQQILDVLESNEDAEMKWIEITGVLLHADTTVYAALFLHVTQVEPPASDKLARKFQQTFTGALRTQIFTRLTQAAGGSEPFQEAAPLEKGWEPQLLEVLDSKEAPEMKRTLIDGVLLNAGVDTYAALYRRLAATHVPKTDKLTQKFHATFSGNLRWQMLRRFLEVGYEHKPRKPDPHTHLPPDVAPGRKSTELNQLGRVDAPDGVYMRNRPGADKETLLPFDTLVHAKSATVEKKGQQRWLYVVALGDARDGSKVMGTGFVEEYHVALGLPEPTAHLYRVRKGQMLKDIAAEFYKIKLEGDKVPKFHGFDARVLVQSIYHANKSRDAVFRQKSDLTTNRKELKTGDLAGAQELWDQARVLKGQAIWIPSYQFAVNLYKAGVIHHGSISRAVMEAIWDATVGLVKGAIDWAKFLAGFVIGILAGAFDALKDLVMGVVDLLKAVWVVVKAIFGDWDDLKAFGKKLEKLWENRSEVVDSIITDFSKKWTAENMYDRGKFQGEVIGYIVMTVLLLLVSLGTLAPVVAAGRLAKIVKLIQFFDKAGDITSYASKMSKYIKLPKKVTNELTDHIKTNFPVDKTAKAVPDAPAPKVLDAPTKQPDVDAPKAPDVPKKQPDADAPKAPEAPTKKPDADAPKAPDTSKKKPKVKADTTKAPDAPKKKRAENKGKKSKTPDAPNPTHKTPFDLSTIKAPLDPPPQMLGTSLSAVKLKPGQDALYILRDSTGEVLKVGKTSDLAAKGRFSVYKRGGKIEKRTVEVEVYPLQKSAKTAEHYEGELRKAMAKDHPMPWDNTGGRLGREGFGTPGEGVRKSLIPRDEMEALLKKHNGDKTKVGEELGIHSRTVDLWAKSLGLRPTDFKPKKKK